MKHLFEDLLMYENLILAYYSNEQPIWKIFLKDDFEIIMFRFLEIFINEDQQKGTNHIQLIRQIYSNPPFENRSDYFQNLHISNSTLQRYRQRYCSTLKLVIEHF